MALRVPATGLDLKAVRRYRYDTRKSATVLFCHHPASEMLGMLIKTRKLHPIVTNPDYNATCTTDTDCKQSWKDELQRYFMQIVCSWGLRVHGPRGNFLWAGASPKVCERVYRSTPVLIWFKFYAPLILFPKNAGQIYTIIHILWLFIGFESNWYFLKRSMTLLGFGNPTPNLEDFDWVRLECFS